MSWEPPWGGVVGGIAQAAHSAFLATQGLGLPEDALHGRDPILILDVEDLELRVGGDRGHRDVWEPVTGPQTQCGTTLTP